MRHDLSDLELVERAMRLGSTHFLTGQLYDLFVLVERVRGGATLTPVERLDLTRRLAANGVSGFDDWLDRQLERAARWRWKVRRRFARRQFAR